MITNNVLTRVFHLRYGNSTGTCFTIDIEDRQYFVTARHVIENSQAGQDIQLYYQRQWRTFRLTGVIHSTHADVSIFSFGQLIAGYEMRAATEGLAFGQDLYFLGFPFGLQSEAGILNREFPLPLVKKGILSSIFFEPPARYMLIDGHNNPGFSGGPVIFKSAPGHPFQVAGVISAYRTELVATLHNGNVTPIQAQANSGIIIAYTIEEVISLITNNRIGVEIV